MSVKRRNVEKYLNHELTFNDNDKSKDIVKTLRNSLTEEGRILVFLLNIKLEEEK